MSVTDISDDVTQIGGAIIGLAIVVVVISQLFGAINLVTAFAATDDLVLVGGNDSITTDDGARVTSVDRVVSSLNDSVELSGSDDSSVAFDVDVSGPRSVCAFASADQPVVGNESRVIAGADMLTVAYNGTNSSYRAWWYNESERASYDVTIDAPDPANRSLVCASVNRTHLSISRNTSERVAAMNAETTVAPPDQNWDGEIDELRVYNDTLSAQQRQDLVSAPLLPVSGEHAAARVTFDSPAQSPSTLPVYYANGSATLSNADLVSGLVGEVLVRGSDYRVDGRTVEALDTRFDDAILWASVNGEQDNRVIRQLKSVARTALILLSLAILVLAVTRLTDELGGGF